MFVAGAFLMAILAGAEAADPDGLSTKMAEVKVVEKLRKQDALLSEFWSKAVSDPETMKRAMMEARKKMKEIAEGAKEGD